MTDGTSDHPEMLDIDGGMIEDLRATVQEPGLPPEPMS